jgi:hypothetical protein
METGNDAQWRTASYSGTSGGNCAEVGQSAGRVLVRDTKNRDGAVLSVPAQAWRGFVAQTKDAR